MTRPPRISEHAGWCNPAARPRGPNGRAICRGGCGREVPPGQRTWCTADQNRWTLVVGPDGRRHREPVRMGEGCLHQHLVRSNPGYARDSCWIRDRGKCAICGVVAPNMSGRHWQADHMVPVAEGGGSCDLSNLRTLCTDCHKGETAALAARRAAARRPQQALPGLVQK